MRWRVSRRTLLLIAGLVWIIAGANILRIGIITWVDDQREWLFKTGEAIVVFLLFFSLIFRRLYNKHTERIGQKADRNCPFSFFDVKGWLIMGFNDYTGDSGYANCIFYPRHSLRSSTPGYRPR